MTTEDKTTERASMIAFLSPSANEAQCPGTNRHTAVTNFETQSVSAGERKCNPFVTK